MSSPALYEIEHVSRYFYTTPVRHCALTLCLKPRDDAGQRLLSYEVATDPPAPLNSETDVFGNTKQVLHVHHEHESLKIASRSTVELTAAAPPGRLDAGAWDEIHSWRKFHRYWDFTNPSAFARPSPVLDAFVNELDIKAEGDPLEALLGLSDTLYRSFEWVPGNTSAASPIEHILESRQGVCQDYAHVMIAISRSWHVPARYVSGYLYISDHTGGGAAPSQPASHAWVECRLPGLGWVGFDATNRCLTDQRHIRVAVGRDYQDVAPVRGIFQGGGESRLDVEVRVESR